MVSCVDFDQNLHLVDGHFGIGDEVLELGGVIDEEADARWTEVLAKVVEPGKAS